MNILSYEVSTRRGQSQGSPPSASMDFDEPRPGRPRTITDEQVEAVIVKTLESTPRDATHWSTRSMAAESGLPEPVKSSVYGGFGRRPVEDRPPACLNQVSAFGIKVYRPALLRGFS